MTWHGRSGPRPGRSALLVLVLAAVLAPGAQASHADGERAPASVTRAAPGPMSSDDRPGVRGPFSRPIIASARSADFEWPYVAIGVAGGLVVVAALGGAVVAEERRRSSGGPATSGASV